MKLELKKFVVTGLYHKISLTLRFHQNMLILVGENGTGKSTAISILHYFLTTQWSKLANYEFESIVLEANDRIFKIYRNELIPSADSTRSSFNMIMREALKVGYDSEARSNPVLQSRIFRIIADKIGVPPRYVRDVLMHQGSDQLSILEESDNLLEIERFLDIHVLYLPTYRRIERELETIFPALEEDVKRFNLRNNKTAETRKHVELVEFGMKDVKTMITSTMQSLDASFRASLDELTSSYLKVILRKEYERMDFDILRNISTTDLDEVLLKIDKSILPDSDQKALRQTIQNFGTSGPVSPIDKLSAHIIQGLVLLHKQQIELEEKVRLFAQMCNKYLIGKKFEFNNRTFTLPIKPIAEGSYQAISDGDIQLNMLSSGEKQIVSLFSHLYLSVESDYLLIIDEPELSLSVTWQEQFLPDVISTGKCSGLVAVTHSPFIYNNKLREHAHSIEEFAERFQ